MNQSNTELDKFVRLLDKNITEDGVKLSPIKDVGFFRSSATQLKGPNYYEPGIVIVGQGEKRCFVGDKTFTYGNGNVLVLFMPMPMEVEIIDATPEKPFLGAGIRLEMGRLADVLLRIERAEGAVAKPVSTPPTGIFSTSLSDHLLDPAIRLLEVMDNPRDAAVLGDMIIDEIYYRLLCDEQGGDLRTFLQQRGEIQRISKTVDYIHENIDKPVSVGDLADMVHMSRTTYYENFREVMHLSPLQYAKSVKLYRAQMLIMEGKNASEAGYAVGYNSPAQFSREYKRHFGYSPSATA